jgi:hypothetical protein
MLQRAFVGTILVATTILTLAAACGSTDSAGTPGATTIGPSGGSVQGSGVTLHIPEGAVKDPVTITVAAADSTTAPDGYVALSPIYQFSPDGLVFEKPAVVEIELVGDATGSTIVWSSGTSVEDLPSTTGAGVMTASVMHFSRGFIGSHTGSPLGDTKDASNDVSRDSNDGAITDASTCHPSGGSCDAGSQCCSGSCNGGMCGNLPDGLCHQNLQSCDAGAQCCSGSCIQGSCSSTF